MKRIIVYMLALGFFACTNPESETNEGNNAPVDITPVAQKGPLSKIDSISKFLDKNPDDADAYNQRAQLYIDEKNLNYAATDIESALAIDSLNPIHYYTRGNLMFAGNKTRLARDSWLQCVKLDPENVDCRLKLGELYFLLPKDGPNSSNFIKSMNNLVRVIELDPQNAKAYYFIGLNYMEERDTSKAITNLQLAVQYDQEMVDAFEVLGALYAGKGDPLAENYYKIAIDLAPNTANLYHNLGVYYKDVGEYNKAIEAYTKAVQIDPDFTEAHYALGYLHYELNVIDVAIMHFTNAITSRERDYKSYFARGLCYERVGDIANAEADYKKSLSIWRYEPAIEALTRLTGKAPQLGSGNQ